MAKQGPVGKGGAGVEQALLLDAMAKASMVISQDHKARVGQLIIRRAAGGAGVVLRETALTATRNRECRSGEQTQALANGSIPSRTWYE
jgi:hypothetical protein